MLLNSDILEKTEIPMQKLNSEKKQAKYFAENAKSLKRSFSEDGEVVIKSAEENPYLTIQERKESEKPENHSNIEQEKSSLLAE